MPLLSVLLSVFIATLAMPCAWLQLHKLKKTGTSDGLSMIFIFLVTISAASWCSYGVTSHEPLQIVVNTSAVLADIGCLALMVKFAPRTWPIIPALILAIGAVMFFGVEFGSAVFGSVGTVIGIGCRTPQLIKSWREPGGVGVSVSSFGLGAVSSCMWIVFGLAHHDMFVLSSASLSIATGLFIIARARKTSDEEVDELALAYATAA